LAEIPCGSLTLAFVDPKGLDVRFETIDAISKRARVDWGVLFADAYDISRNAEQHYRGDPNSKLDQVLGPNSNWRERLDRLDNPTGFAKRHLFAQIYKGQLQRRLKYPHVEPHTINFNGRPLYKLIYASKDELGLKFWHEALKKEPSGPELSQISSRSRGEV
jgi:three-Cys-motif partner protein